MKILKQTVLFLFLVMVLLTPRYEQGFSNLKRQFAKAEVFFKKHFERLSSKNKTVCYARAIGLNEQPKSFGVVLKKKYSGDLKLNSICRSPCEQKI
jgi:hypothetical protein